MFERRTAWQVLQVAAVAGATALITTSCISPDTNSNTTQVTPQGTVELEKIRAGMPETVFQSARITFAVDTHKEASKGGKTQYISRTYNAKGGQYLAQCKDNVCFQLQVLYPTPVPTADALATVAALVPSDAGAESSLDDSVLKNSKTPMATDFHYFGTKALVIVNYADKKADKVTSISAYAMAPEKALKQAFGKVPPQMKIPESSKTPAVAEGAKPAPGVK